MSRKPPPDLPDHIGRAIEGALRRISPWEGAVSELLPLLRAEVPDEIKTDRGWPRSVTHLGRVLRQIAPRSKTKYWRIRLVFSQRRVNGVPMRLIQIVDKGLHPPRGNRVKTKRTKSSATSSDDVSQVDPSVSAVGDANEAKRPKQAEREIDPMNPPKPKEPLPRCQATNRSGEQCARIVAEGKRVCFLHGAGKVGGTPGGGPKTIYAMLGGPKMAEMRQRVLEYGHDLDNSDEELVNMRAGLLFMFDRMADEEDPEAQAAIVERLMSHSHRIIRAIKERAETSAKRAEARALEGALVVVTAVRNIVWELLDDATLDLFEQRLRREVLAPRQLALPSRTEGRNNGN